MSSLLSGVSIDPVHNGKVSWFKIGSAMLCCLR